MTTVAMSSGPMKAKVFTSCTNCLSKSLARILLPGGPGGGYNGGGTLATGDTNVAISGMGGVAHVALYNYALTAGQILNHYFYGVNVSPGSVAPYFITQVVGQTNYIGPNRHLHRRAPWDLRRLLFNGRQASPAAASIRT